MLPECMLKLNKHLETISAPFLHGWAELIVYRDGAKYRPSSNLATIELRVKLVNLAVSLTEVRPIPDLFPLFSVALVGPVDTIHFPRMGMSFEASNFNFAGIGWKL